MNHHYESIEEMCEKNDFRAFFIPDIPPSVMYSIKNYFQCVLIERLYAGFVDLVDTGPIIIVARSLEEEEKIREFIDLNTGPVDYELELPCGGMLLINHDGYSDIPEQYKPNNKFYIFPDKKTFLRIKLECKK